TFFPRRLELSEEAGAADSPFSPFEVVVLGDVAQHQMPPGGWEALDRFVREEGGTLVLQAGKRHMPLGYNRQPILDALLPVTGLRVLNLTGKSEETSPAERGFR